MKKRVIAVLMMLAMLVCMMSSAVFAADNGAKVSMRCETDGTKLTVYLELTGEASEFEATLQLPEKLVQDQSLSYEFTEAFTDFVSENKGVEECGVPYDAADRIVFGAGFAEPVDFGGYTESAIATVTVDTEALADGEGTVNLYSGGQLVDTYEIVSTPPYILGDANGNGDVTTDDALAVLKHVVKLNTLTGDNFKAADANLDGNITTDDALLILKHVVKLTTLISG